MPRRKKLNFEEEEINSYYYNGGGSLEYNIDNYNNPTNYMSNTELKALAQYINVINDGRAGGKDEEEEEEKKDYRKVKHLYILPADPLYPGDFDDDEE